MFLIATFRLMLLEMIQVYMDGPEEYWNGDSGFNAWDVIMIILMYASGIIRMTNDYSLNLSDGSTFLNLLKGEISTGTITWDVIVNVALFLLLM
jgi:hypothetical protein